MLPILLNHNASLENVVGYIKTDTTGGLDVTFNEGQEKTNEEIFKIFGNCSFLVYEMIEKQKGIFFIKRFRIISWGVEG